MSRVCLFLLLGCLLVMSGGVVGQDKKDDPPVKYKGMLPSKWGQLGLSDEQKQNIYKVQTLRDGEIKKLEAKIAELKSARMKEMLAVLTPDQRKKLEEILLGKDK
jgi:hypothetical protein